MEVNTSKIYCLSSLLMDFLLMFYTLPCLVVTGNYMGAAEVFPQIIKMEEGSKKNDVMELWKFSLKMGVEILN